MVKALYFSWPAVSKIFSSAYKFLSIFKFLELNSTSIVHCIFWLKEPVMNFFNIEVFPTFESPIKITLNWFLLDFLKSSFSSTYELFKSSSILAILSISTFSNIFSFSCSFSFFIFLFFWNWKIFLVIIFIFYIIIQIK